MKKLEAWFENEIDDDVLSAICATLIEHDAKFYVHEESAERQTTPLFNCPPVCGKCGAIHRSGEECFKRVCPLCRQKHSPRLTCQEAVPGRSTYGTEHENP